MAASLLGLCGGMAALPSHNRLDTVSKLRLSMEACSGK